MDSTHLVKSSYLKTFWIDILVSCSIDAPKDLHEVKFSDFICINFYSISFRNSYISLAFFKKFMRFSNEDNTR